MILCQRNAIGRGDDRYVSGKQTTLPCFDKFFRKIPQIRIQYDCDNSHVTLVDLKNFPCVEKKACLLIHILEPFHPGLMIIIISMFS